MIDINHYSTSSNNYWISNKDKNSTSQSNKNAYMAAPETLFERTWKRKGVVLK